MDRALRAASVCWAVLQLACAASAEEQTLLRFFEAARTLDSTIVGRYATVGFNPRTEGTVQSFHVRAIGAETGGQPDWATAAASLGLPRESLVAEAATQLEMMVRELTIDAVVLDPAGAMSTRTLRVTFQRARITRDGRTHTGRWIVTGLRPTPASRISPAASSARPS